MDEKNTNQRGLVYMSYMKTSILAIVVVSATYFGSSFIGNLVFRADIENYQQTAAAAEAKLDSIFNEYPGLMVKSGMTASVINTRNIPTFDVDTHIPDTGKVVVADLAGMKVTLYQNKKAVGEYSIISKGKEGSRWQTPVGAYNIQSKERTHLSSIGEVYMPYSMEFYGNFFIHGWPTYPNGTPVRLGYTGGCIRLATSDAKNVYAFADIGTPILVYESTTGEQVAKGIMMATGTPQIAAESYLVADMGTGEVFAEKNATEIRPIASLTKLVTAIVANEAITYNKQIKITKHVTDTLGEKTLKQGDVFTATELLYPLLMQSDNGAAVALGDAYGSSGFIKLMNAKAAAIGMDNTHFEDVHGISEKNTSTAEDLFRLSRYFYDNQRFLLDITKLPQKTIPATAYNSRYDLYNFNVFSGMPEFLGGKTGKTTAAKETMVALFSYADPDNAQSTSTLAIIVLGSDDRKQDVTKLHDWTLASLNNTPPAAITRAQ